jgi:hypothetical protein
MCYKSAIEGLQIVYQEFAKMNMLVRCYLLAELLAARIADLVLC